jgi:hypothetical protein
MKDLKTTTTAKVEGRSIEESRTSNWNRWGKKGGGVLVVVKLI